MARTRIRYIVRDDDGPVVINSRVYPRITGTSTPVPDAFATLTGGVATDSFVTNAQGELDFYIEQHRPSIDLFITDNAGAALIPAGSTINFASFTEPVSVPVDPANTVLVPTEDRIRYVSLGGQDVNDGLTRGQPKRWVQTAIDGLAALGGGEVHVGNGVFVHEWAAAQNVSVIGRGKRLTTFKAVTASIKKGVITLEPGQIISCNFRNFEVIGSGNVGQHGIYLKGVGRSVAPFDGGLWHSEFKHLIVRQFDGEAIWFHAGGNGLIPHQFIDLVAIEAYASGNYRALRLSGQVGQMQVLGGLYDGQGRGLGIENILVQRAVNDDGTNAGDVAPYEISFEGVTSQASKRAATIERAYGVNFDKCYFEELHEGVSYDVSALKGSVSRSKFAEVYKTGGTGYCVRAGNNSNVSTSDNSYIGNIDRSVIAEGGFAQSHDDYNTAGVYEGAGHTRQIVAAATVNLEFTTTFLCNAGVTPITTITSQRSPGELVHIKAHSDGPAIRFATGGNIELGGRASPVIVPTGGVASFVRYDLSGAWHLVSVSHRQRIDAKLYRATALNLPSGVDTRIPWDAEEFDNGGLHDNVTNPTRLTCPDGEGGTYLVGYSIASDSDFGAANRWLVQVYVNNGPLRGSRTELKAKFPSASATTIVDLTPAGYVEVSVFHDLGVDAVLGLGASGFWMRKVG